jgi:molybdate transport system ATP-binding protein
MVSGDHPQAYANDIYLFGKRRGSGESIWEIKQRLGVVSSEFQMNYRKPISAFDVVLSGFFDSVGLYRRADSGQVTTAQAWIKRLGLGHLKAKRYDLLSFGERRMILMARAVVKDPEILVLDEPCQGLDPANRRRILCLVDVIGRQPPYPGALCFPPSRRNAGLHYAPPGPSDQ